MTSEELENTRRLFKDHKGIDARPSKWYHSVTDPEAKVIINFDEGKLIIRDKDLWKAFVSNTWLKDNG